MDKPRKGQRVKAVTAVGDHKTGTVINVNKAHRHYTVQFVAVKGQAYCESYKY